METLCGKSMIPNHRYTYYTSCRWGLRATRGNFIDIVSGFVRIQRHLFEATNPAAYVICIFPITDVKKVESLNDWMICCSLPSEAVDIIDSFLP
jgi:hypothetical protein